MSDAELKALLRPLVAEIARRAGDARERRVLALVAAGPAGQSFSEGVTPTPHSGDDGEPTGFTAADLGRLRDYYAADADGCYPGQLHRAFGCGVKQFADATGLVRRGATRDGRAVVVWAERGNGKADAKAFGEGFEEKDHPRGEDGKFAKGGGGGGGGGKPASNRDEWQARADARSDRRDAATDARTRHTLDAPKVAADWASGLSPDDHAAGLAAHIKDYDSHHAATRSRLEAAGATETELTEFDRLAAKGREKTARLAERAAKARAKAAEARAAADDHDAARAAIEAEEPDPFEEEPEPEEPEELEEPDEPDEPDAPTDAAGDTMDGPPKRAEYDSGEDGDAAFEEDARQWAEFDKEYDAYESAHKEWKAKVRDVRAGNQKARAEYERELAGVRKRNEKGEADHEKSAAAWEKKLERHDEKAEKLTDRATELEVDADDADSEYLAGYETATEHTGEYVSEVEDAVIDRTTDEDEADEEPEDEEPEDEEPEDEEPEPADADADTFADSPGHNPPHPGLVYDPADHHYHRPDSGEGGGDHGKGAAGDTPAAEPDLSPLDAEPALENRPALLARVKDAAKRAAAVLSSPKSLLYELALNSPQILDAVGLVLDTPEDMKKIGYNPTTAGAEGSRVADAADFTGLTTYQTLNVVVKVGGAVLSAVRQKLAGKGGKMADGTHTPEDVAAALHELLAAVAGELGLAPPPAAEEVATRLAGG